MTILLMRQYLTLAILAAMVWMLWVIRPAITSMPTPAIHVTWHRPVSYARPPMAAIEKQKPAPAGVAQAKDINHLPLHSIERQYTYLFTGRVMCGQAPCKTADVQVTLQSIRNGDVHQSTTSNPDGTFSLQIALVEFPQGQIDWTMVAHSNEARRVELSGHHILTEQDSTVVVEKSIHLL
jgi:hypothetical protein